MDIIFHKLIMLPGILLGLTVHEYAHAKAACMLGDPTAKNQGRVSLNPLKHVDVIGFLCLLVAGFGWGKPVPVNNMYFKHQRRDNMIVSVAGVTMNLIVAIFLAFLINIIYLTAPGFFDSQTGSIVAQILHSSIWINVILMVFNLIPVPPLDGFNIVSEATGFSRSPAFEAVYTKGPVILILLVITNATDYILMPGINTAYKFINALVSMVF